jgi:hypothetical protein
MRFPRMTTRRWMLAVAAVAVVAGVLIATVRHRPRRTARIHADAERYYSHVARECRQIARAETKLKADEARFLSKRIDWYDRKTSYHRELKLKYERAALRPWLPLQPDPPEPEP